MLSIPIEVAFIAIILLGLAGPVLVGVSLTLMRRIEKYKALLADYNTAVSKYGELWTEKTRLEADCKRLLRRNQELSAKQFNDRPPVAEAASDFEPDEIY